MPPVRRRPPKKPIRGRSGDTEGENVLLDEDHTRAVSSLLGEDSAGGEGHQGDTTAGSGRDEERTGTAIERLAEQLPIPDGTTVDEGEPVTAEDRAEAEHLEQVVGAAQALWWLRGQSLQRLRDRRYYKRIHGYPSFDTYLEAEWDVSRQQAAREIQAWPLARRLWPVNNRINERQVRALLPLVDRYGFEAAAEVYEAVMTALEHRGGRVSGSMLETVGDTVAAALPAGMFDASVARKTVEAAMRTLAVEPKLISPAPTGDELDAFAVALSKGIKRLEIIGIRVAEHAAENPDQARAFASELRTIAGRIEASLVGEADTES